MPARRGGLVPVQGRVPLEHPSAPWARGMATPTAAPGPRRGSWRPVRLLLDCVGVNSKLIRLSCPPETSSMAPPPSGRSSNTIFSTAPGRRAAARKGGARRRLAGRRVCVKKSVGADQCRNQKNFYAIEATFIENLNFQTGAGTLELAWTARSGLGGGRRRQRARLAGVEPPAATSCCSRRATRKLQAR